VCTAGNARIAGIAQKNVKVWSFTPSYSLQVPRA
jgi:hypothetical protein